MPVRDKVLKLYRDILREADKFPSYSFRMYAKRKIRDSFRANKDMCLLCDIGNIKKKIEMGEKNLQVIRRQAIIGHLYEAEKSVLEQKKTLHPSED